MKRFFNLIGPKSLYSQILMAAAIALLIAQIINAAFLLGGLRDRGVIEASNVLMNSAAIRMQVNGFEELERPQSRAERRAQIRQRREQRRTINAIGGRNLDYIRSEKPLLLNEFTQDDASSQRASALMSIEAIMHKGLIAQMPSQLKEPMIIRRNQRTLRSPNSNLPEEVMIISFQSNGHWIYAAHLIRPLSKRAIWMLIIQTLLLYAVLLSVLAFIARHISRPLDRLKEAMEHFGPNDLGHEIEAKGPHDVRELIDNYNDMRARISALLSEKDVMLGAIGHDLKTPLASLRVRVESVEHDDERTKMINSIDDMNVMLSDILMLARLGKSNEALEKTDIGSLVEAVIDDFSEQSDDIKFTLSAAINAQVKPSLLRRALRNIISNALRYGGNAHIIAEQNDGDFKIMVDDDGPGLSLDKMEAVFEPFHRLDESRNSALGGTGLGLTISRAIVRAHAGEIKLENREPKGLRVIITLPI